MSIETNSSRNRAGPFPGVLTYLRRLVAQPLVLTVSGDTFTFDSIEDFASWLDPRSSVTPERLEALRTLSDVELHNQSSEIRGLERKLATLLVHAIEKPETIVALVENLGLARFTNDHDWRTIVASVLSADGPFDEHRKLAVAKYIQYLNDRIDTLKAVCRERHMVCQEVREDDARQDEQPWLRETRIFDAAAHPAELHSGDSVRFQRVPIGETVRLSVPADGQVALRLSLHPFTMTIGAECSLTDERGARYPLKTSRNVIGRDTKNDVVIDPTLRAVSRVHMLVALSKHGTVDLTDYSSQGTFLACPFSSATTGRAP